MTAPQGAATSIIPKSVRVAAGIISLVLLGAGLAALGLDTDRAVAGVLVRVGSLVGAFWLVSPLIRRPGWASIGAVAAAGLILIRPRLLAALIVGVVIWRLSRRGKTRPQPSPGSAPRR